MTVLAATSVLAVPCDAAALCPNQDAPPDQLSVDEYTATLACVVNETRQEYGRGPLAPQRNLTRAAGWHASDMSDNGYFSHTEPTGTTFADRLDAVNFIPSSGRWRAGENLAAGRHGAGSPAAIVDGWMNSHDHRVNLLDPGFTLVGIGVSRGWPAPRGSDVDAVTIAMDLGWRTSTRR